MDIDDKEITYTIEDGKVNSNEITVYALSTCGFCKRGLKFLRDNSVKFKFTYIDQLDYDVKQKLKKELAEKFSKRVVFPYLVMNGDKVLVGFMEDEWKQNILV
jgi:glutaredoxin-like protein NrdH